MNELMPGVNILNIVEIDTAAPMIVWALFISLSIALVVLGLIAFCDDRKYNKGFLILAIGMFFALVGEVYGCVSEHISDNRYYQEYSVTIDENVSFKELYEKYEVIKVEGQIYTLKERK